MNPGARARPSFLRIAHRGASGQAPENTLLAFRRAVELGTDAIETDLRPTRDAAVVLIHDATVDRTTGSRGRVARLTRAELGRLEAGQGEHIPALEELLEWARPLGLELLLELKQEPAVRSGWVEAAVRGVESEGLLDRATFLSFDRTLLKRVRTAQPRARTGWLVSRRLGRPWRTLEELGVSILAPEWRRVSRDLIEQAHEHGFRVVTWTVDDPSRMERLISWGVDGLATNYPDRLNQVLGK